MKNETIQQHKKINPLYLPGIKRNRMEATIRQNDYGSVDNILYPELKKIGSIVAEYMHMDLWHLKLRCRKREIVQARQIAMYFSKHRTKYSLFKIGSFFGGHDHATVLHACKTVNNLRDTDREYRKDVNAIQKEIQHIFSLSIHEPGEVGPAYTISIDHENRQVTIKTNDSFDYLAFQKLTNELEEKEISDNYKIVIL
ncbi:MAG: helix-turn-helix domain-containing protein [Bacteroidota bacterium]